MPSLILGLCHLEVKSSEAGCFLFFFLLVFSFSELQDLPQHVKSGLIITYSADTL